MQSAAVCRILPQFTAICHKITAIFFWHVTVFAGLTLTHPFVAVKIICGPKMGFGHFIGPSSPQIPFFSGFFPVSIGNLKYINGAIP
jgi:hypothetical protein